MSRRIEMQQQQSDFTPIEWMVVVAIIGLLAVAAVAQYSGTPNAPG